jgi:hypothetical protein
VRLGETCWWGARRRDGKHVSSPHSIVRSVCDLLVLMHVRIVESNFVDLPMILRFQKKLTKWLT